MNVFFKQLKYWWKYEYGYWMKISMKEILLLCTFHSAGRAPCWQLGENLQIFDRDNKTWKCCISFKIISNWTLFRCKKIDKKDFIRCTIMDIMYPKFCIGFKIRKSRCKQLLLSGSGHSKWFSSAALQGVIWDWVEQ